MRTSKKGVMDMNINSICCSYMQKKFNDIPSRKHRLPPLYQDKTFAFNRIHCYKCIKPINDGDRFIGRRFAQKYYHKRCFETMFQ